MAAHIGEEIGDGDAFRVGEQSPSSGRLRQTANTGFRRVLRAGGVARRLLAQTPKCIDAGLPCQYSRRGGSAGSLVLGVSGDSLGQLEISGAGQPCRLGHVRCNLSQRRSRSRYVLRPFADHALGDLPAGRRRPRILADRLEEGRSAVNRRDGQAGPTLVQSARDLNGLALSRVRCPLMTCKGVCPFLSRAFALAPAASNVWICSLRFGGGRRCSGVFRPCSSRALISPVSFSNSRRAWPRPCTIASRMA